MKLFLGFAFAGGEVAELVVRQEQIDEPAAVARGVAVELFERAERWLGAIHNGLQILKLRYAVTLSHRGFAVGKKERDDERAARSCFVALEKEPHFEWPRSGRTARRALPLAVAVGANLRQVDTACRTDFPGQAAPDRRGSLASHGRQFRRNQGENVVELCGGRAVRPC